MANASIAAAVTQQNHPKSYSKTKTAMFKPVLDSLNLCMADLHALEDLARHSQYSDVSIKTFRHCAISFAAQIMVHFQTAYDLSGESAFNDAYPGVCNQISDAMTALEVLAQQSQCLWPSDTPRKSIAIQRAVDTAVVLSLLLAAVYSINRAISAMGGKGIYVSIYQ